MSRYDEGWAPYVPVAVRRAKAKRQMGKLRKQGTEITPVEIEGRKITRTFWGSAWCDHLESFSDFANRLPRGRAYVRNGSVCHLAITKGKIAAIVSGSVLYNIRITINTLPRAKWKAIQRSCTGQISSLIELLQGAFSDEVMQVVAHRQNGLFPHPNEIKFDCDCPDWATMCKHVSAVLYGVGARLDSCPEMLFTLRGVHHEELISGDTAAAVDAVVSSRPSRRRRMKGSLSSVFGVDVDEKSNGDEKSIRAVKQSPAPVAKRAKSKISKKDKPLATTAPTAKAIRDLRAGFAMSQAEFARIMGVSAASVSHWERNTGHLKFRKTTLNTWKKICHLNKNRAERRLKSS